MHVAVVRTKARMLTLITWGPCSPARLWQAPCSENSPRDLVLPLVLLRQALASPLLPSSTCPGQPALGCSSGPPPPPCRLLVLPMVLKYAHQNFLPRASTRPPPRPDQGLDVNGLPTGLPRSRPGKRRLLHACCSGQGGPQGQQAELTPVLLLSRPVSPSATARCGWTPAPRPSAASWRPPWAGPGLSAASPAPAPTR